MGQLKIFLFGLPRLERDGQSLAFQRRRALALLAYLAVKRQPQSRDTLHDLIWPTFDRASAQNNLRRELSLLNSSFGEPLLAIDRGRVAFDGSSSVQVDVNEFLAHLTKARTLAGSPDHPSPKFIMALTQAVALYSNGFLAGFGLPDSVAFDEWQFFEAESLRRACAEALQSLIECHIHREAYDQALVPCQQWVALDPLHEPAQRQMMQLLSWAGQRPAALRQYERYVQLLAEQYEVEPEPATTELYEQIRAGKPLTEPAAPAAVKPIRGYELREAIGEGAFGAVYRAYQPVVGREVAIKVIKPEYADQPDFIRRFETEARLWARLEHPFIVPLYDYWREPGGAYLVMRYLPGSLRDRLQRGPLTLSETTRLVEQIAAALTVAHRSGVIHRDLKPANLLLDDEGNAYLGDFGIAKALVQTSETTQEGQIVGSPGYLSPERIKGEPVSPSADLYSFGVVIYEILTGQHPFPGDLTPSALLYKQLSEPLPSVHERRPELPAALDEVIQRATAKDPADRYPDALSLAETFRQAAGAVAPVRGAEERVPLVRAAVEGERTWTPADDLVALRNPYKGLHAFEEADAPDFFGREALVKGLLTRLAEEGDLARFLAVVGPSGSGKSSVVKAGLIPALRRGALPGSEWWYVAEMLPGPHPMEEVELALTRLAAVPGLNLLPVLHENERGLLRAVRQVLPDSASQLLLVVDQFEEIFTLVEDPAEAAHFLDSLYAAVTAPRSPLRVILTLRADFTDRPLLYAEFGELLRQRIEFVLPLTAKELNQAITAPAQQVGVKLDPTLLAAITADVHDEPGILPLLEYALTEVFERRDDHRLTLAGYQAVGGVLGALARRAEVVYARQTHEQQVLARQVFLRLVTLGEGTEDTRRRVRQSELVAVAPDTVLLQTVLDAFTQARLLTRDRDALTREPTVEVAHEALLRRWLRLRAWLEESRADVREQRVLAAAADDWQGAGRERSFLFTGSRLAQFEDWAARTDLALTSDERAFLEASILEQAQQQARRRRVRNLAFGITAAVALIMAVLALVAFDRQRQAQDARARSETNLLRAWDTQALFLADLSEKQHNLGDKRGAILLAEEGLAHYANGIHHPENFQALLDALSVPGLEQLHLPHNAPVSGATWNADESRILTWSDDGTARVWNAVSGDNLLTLQHDDAVSGATWNADESRILTWSKDGTARVWDAISGDVLLTLSHGDPVSGAARNADETRILTWAGYTVLVWDAASGEKLLTLSHEDRVQGAAWNREATCILTWSDDFTVRVWDAATGESLLTLRHDAKALGAMWNADETRILTWSEDGTARVWDAATGAMLYALRHDDPVTGARWNADETRILTWSWDDTACVWDAATGDNLLILRHSGNVNGAVWNADETRILTWSEDKFARVWDARRGSILQTLPHDGPVKGAAWDQSETRILAWSQDGTARVWDTASRSELFVVRHDNSDKGVSGAAWSRDETRILTWSGDHTARTWDASDSEGIRVMRHEDSVQGALWSPDQTRLLTWSWDNTARVWDAVSGAILYALPHEDPVKGAMWTRDGARILTWTGAAARVWDAVSGAKLHEFFAQQRGGSKIERVEWNADETAMRVCLSLMRSAYSQFCQLWDASSGAILVEMPNVGIPQAWNTDETRLLSRSTVNVLIWDTASPTPVLTLRHDQEVDGAVWNADETRILTWAGSIARVWNAASGDALLTLEHQAKVSTATWNADQTWILTAAGDRVQVWDAHSGVPLFALPVSSGPLAGAAWSPDETQILAWGQDQVWVWDVAHLELVLTLTHTTPVLGAAWSQDGTQIVSWAGSTVQLWTVAADRLMALAARLQIRPLTDAEREQFFLPALASSGDAPP